MEKVSAIVLAAGQGRRMNTSIQKQFLQLKNKPVLVHTIEAFEKSDVDEIIVVTSSSEIDYVKSEIVKKYNLKKVKSVVEGGEERYHSVFCGLKACSSCSYVLIHDGARPLVTESIINRAIESTKVYKSCVVGMPVKDTIKVADEHGVAIKTPDRKYLWQIQTPQAFQFELIYQAYQMMLDNPDFCEGITDDAMVVERMKGIKVHLIEGSYENLKVTTPEDLILAEALLMNRA